MVVRPVLTEPFEAVVVDIVGPLPKFKGGLRWVLTVVCTATRWPDAVAFKEISAKTDAQGFIDILSRTALPMQLLSVRGTQFPGSVMRGFCKLLSIEKFQTTAYHPQYNGMVEHMHSTLEGMLTIAHSLGQDWVFQLPFALFALRQALHRDTGLSPFELVFDWRVRTPLELLYHGWMDECDVSLDVCSWWKR